MKAHFLRATRLGVLSCFFIAVLVLMTSTASAYSVTLTNESGAGSAGVWVYVRGLFDIKLLDYAFIPDGQSHTFSTGALCPARLEGRSFSGRPGSLDGLHTPAKTPLNISL